MAVIRRMEGYLAAHALLVDIATSLETDPSKRVLVILKLVKQPHIVADMVANVFDQVGRAPDIASEIEKLAGLDFAIEYCDAIHGINEVRRRQGRTALPLQFHGEASVPDNHSSIADWKARRAAA